MYKLQNLDASTTPLNVELVDGGLHDNQGIQGLFDFDCSHLIVSDASGQYMPHLQPLSQIPGVFKRTLDIYGARVRQEQ